MGKRLVFLTAGVATAVLAVAGIAGVAAQTGEDSESNPLGTFMERLAANLGIGEDELESAIDQTFDEMVDEAAARGDISPERAEALKERDLGGLLRRLGESKGFDWGGPDGERGHPFRHGRLWFGPGPFGGALPEAADIIGIELRELLQGMAEGKTLAEVAAEHGMTRDDLKQQLLDEYSADLDELLDHSFEFGWHEDDGPSATPSRSSTPGS
jgi:hypothetical protein